MNMYNTIRTPIDTINILNAGGIRQGSIAQFYGIPGSGKSTFCYQTAGLFLKDNPDASVHIIDVENSVDMLRLEKVFKLDMERVKIHHYSSLEESFQLLIEISKKQEYQSIGKYKIGKKEIKLFSKSKLESIEDNDFFKYCEQFDVGFLNASEMIDCSKYQNDRKKLLKVLTTTNGYTIKENNGMCPVLVIWDTIAVSRSRLEIEKVEAGNTAKNAAGMNVSTQIITSMLSMVLSKMGGKPLTLFLPNQVRLKDFGSFMGPKESFYGSYALEHNCHYIFKFTKIKTSESRKNNYDDDMKMRTGSDIKMTIEKTKFCPVTQDIALYINDQLGGVIVPGEELAHLAIDLKLLNQGNGGWYQIESNKELGKLKWSKDEAESANVGDRYIRNNPKIRKILMEDIIRHYRKSYFTLDELYKLNGKDELGKISDEDKKNQRTVDDEVILNSMDSDIFKI